MNKDISKCKFFITGGGTGGHIYPAVSIIKEVIKNGALNENVFYIGNKNNLEYTIAKDNGFQFLSTPVFGMPRKISFKFIKWVICLFIAIIKALCFVIKYKPDVVFGTGGYVSAPALFAAKLFKIPYVLHDSDCHPGIVTRKFAKNAFAVNLAFEDAKKYINSKNIKNYLNPVRAEFFNKTKDEARGELNINNEFLILIMGGSQGAKSINDAALSLIELLSERDDIRIILQTGKKNYDEIVKDLKVPNNTRIEPYFDDMSIPIMASDLIVSRAGSISISEILSSGTPSILVPYPYAAADHQRVNARSISDKNAAVYLEDEDVKNGKLNEAVLNLIGDKSKYNLIKENASLYKDSYKCANSNILNLILEAIR